MSDVVAQDDNFLNKTTRLIAGGDNDDDNDEPSTNFDLTNPIIFTAYSPLTDQSITAMQALASQEGEGIVAVGGDNAGTGVHGKGGASPSLPSLDPTKLSKAFGIGVYGQSGDTPSGFDMSVTGMSGVRGESVKGHGVVGVSSEGDGVHGASAKNGVLGRGAVGVIGDGFNSSTAKESQIGVIGTTEGSAPALTNVPGSNEGVRGYSKTGFALRGVSEQNRAGVFETRGTTAQVRLVPTKVLHGDPTPNGQQLAGLSGDLVVLKTSIGDATLWFCFRDGVHWKQIA